jgi:hypothetical protein
MVSALPGSVGAQERIVPRTIIAFYDSAVDRSWQTTMLHKLAEMPLNHLGLVVEPHDINKTLPDLTGRDDVRGVLTWWESDAIPGAARFIEWSSAAIDAGKRFVILGNFGFGSGSAQAVPRAAANSFLRRLGLRARPQSSDNSFTARATLKVSEMVEYERKLPIGLPLYDAVRSTDPTARVYLRVEQPGNSEPADLVVTTSQGGYVAVGYIHYQGSSVEEAWFQQWYLNPFAFFREAFATDDLPKPDVTTAAGRRLYFSHVDGDGWRSMTQIQSYRGQRVRAIDVLIERVFTAFPNLPVTVAPIAGDLDPTWCGDEQAQEAARHAFALPNVEPATHTYSHPYSWNSYRAGQPPWEPTGQANCDGSEAAGHVDLPDAAEDESQSPHAHGAPSAGRAYRKLAFDLEREIAGSATYINKYVPPGKCVRLVQWSGDTSPFRDALRAVRESGLVNINGGDARFDSKFRSVSWVAPIARHTSGELQIYAAASNENTYTANWTAEFGGFRALPETLERTETPRRLLPINVYYHAYSGEKPASLNALLANLRYAEQQEIAPVPTSTYVAIAQGFFTTRLVTLGPRTWRVEGRGALQTIRIDNATAEEVDLSRSAGLLGWRRKSESLYVALDPAHVAPVIALRPLREAAEPPAPALIQSRWLVESLAVSGDRFTFAARGFGPGEMTWLVPKPGRYGITAATTHGVILQEAERAPDGTLAIRIPASGSAGAGIRVVWQGEADATATAEALPEVPPLLGQEPSPCPH